MVNARCGRGKYIKSSIEAGIKILDDKEIVGYLYYVAYPFAGEDIVDLLYC